MPGRIGVVVAATLAGTLLGGGGLIGRRWYRYVTAGETPYDEIGIALNGRMPGSLRAWGCARIAERFPRTPPPYGCQDQPAAAAAGAPQPAR